jgi:hypothetical protein
MRTFPGRFLLAAFLFWQGDLSAQAPPVVSARYNNDQPYNWYRTQFDTGPVSGNNCGPTSLHMTMMYQDGSPQKAPSVADIRTWKTGSTQNGGDWYWNVDMPEVLDHYGYRWEQYMLQGKNQADVTAAMKKYLRDGSVLILCINAGSLSEADYPKTTRYDRFYSGLTGHFVVAKGYLDDENWLVVYDPWVMNGDSYYSGTYPAGNPMGKERYYKMSEIVTTVMNWNGSDKKYAFTAVPKPALSNIFVIDVKRRRVPASQSPAGIFYALSGSGPMASRAFNLLGKEMPVINR